MLSSNSYDLDFNSLNYARKVVSWEWEYEALKKSVWKFARLLLASPVSLVFGFWLSTKRKAFTKQMRKKHVVVHTSSEYNKLRSHLDEVRALYPFLKKVKKLDLKDLPWAVRYCGFEMQKMTNTLLQYFTWLEKELDCLNTEQFKSQSKTFNFTSEKELWENRNKAYQYWM